MPETPWSSYCPCDHDACAQATHWCQLPWCYVGSSCPGKVASTVFKGSPVAWYSYDTCGSPDCFTPTVGPSGERMPDNCPWGPGQNGWYTKHLTCAKWTDNKSPQPAPVPSGGAVASA